MLRFNWDWNKFDEYFADVLGKSIISSFTHNHSIEPTSSISGDGTYDVDLPGCVKKDIEITHSGNSVSIKAKRKNGASYSLKLKISECYDLETLSAKYEDGVLKLSAKQKNIESPVKKTIPIE
jgi:HSP20 family molecular chaperone IbpA